MGGHLKQCFTQYFTSHRRNWPLAEIISGELEYISKTLRIDYELSQRSV